MCQKPMDENDASELLQVEQRYKELTELGIGVSLVCVGIKGRVYFGRRPQYKINSAHYFVRTRSSK